MTDRFDVAILGAGPGGEHAAYAQVAAGRSVLLIERELIGGECTNWACIPTKTLLRPTEVRGESQRAAGIHEAAWSGRTCRAYRDYMTSAGDDSARGELREDGRRPRARSPAASPARERSRSTGPATRPSTSSSTPDPSP